jgi:phosphinothricin acetyltransferase
MSAVEHSARLAYDVVAMADEHAEGVLAVYQAGLDTGNASFQDRAPSWPEFSAAKLADHRFVALREDGRVLGWVAVSAVSKRPVYAGVVELSVYVAAEARGAGIGTALLDRLIASTQDAGIWTLQAGVFPENAASLAIHERAGFRRVGVQEKLGRHGERGWRDVVLLERRSEVVG